MPRPKYRRSFSKPALPKNVFLRYNQEDKKWSYSTHEKQLIALILKHANQQQLSENTYQHGLLLVIYGLGGMGKSISLRGLCYKLSLRDFFPDGIIYFSLGKSLSNEQFIEKLAMIVEDVNFNSYGDKILSCKSLEAAVHKTIEVFHKKQVLFLVDDVHSGKNSDFKHLRALQSIVVNAFQSMLIITTREKALANEAVESIFFDNIHLPKQYAKQIFGSHAHFQEHDIKALNGQGRHHLNHILRQCSGIKSCIAIAGSIYRELTSHEHNYDINKLLGLAARRIRETPQLLTNMPIQGYDKLESVTLELLNKIEDNASGIVDAFRNPQHVSFRCLFESFAIFQQNEWVPISILCNLSCLSVADMSFILRTFVDHGLVEKGQRTDDSASITETNVAIRVSGILTTVSRFMGRNSGQLQIWHEKMVQLMSRFPQVKKFFPDENTTSPSDKDIGTSPGSQLIRDLDINQAYIRENLVRHMVEASMLKEVCNLVTNMKWIVRRTWPKLKKDYVTIITSYESSSIPSINHVRNRELIDGLRTISRILDEGYHRLRENRHQLLFEIYGRMGTNCGRIVGEFLKNMARTINVPWIRPSRKIVLPDESRETFSLDTLQLNITCVCYRDNVMVLALESGNVEVYEILDQEKDTLEGIHHDHILAMAMSNDKRYIVTGSWSGTVQLWDLKSGGVTGKLLQAHRDSIRCLQFSRDDKVIATGSSDRTVLIWNPQTMEAVGNPLIGHERKVECLAFSPTERKLITGSWDSTVRLWNLEDGTECKPSLKTNWVGTRSIAFNSDGSLVVAGSHTGELCIWNISNRTTINYFRCNSNFEVSCVEFSHDSRKILAAGYDNEIYCYDIKSGEPVSKPYEGHKDWVLSASFTKDETQIVSVSKDGTLKTWNYSTTRNSLRSDNGHFGWIWALAINADGTLIASGATDTHIMLWDTDTGTRVGRPLRGHSGRIRLLSFSEDGKRLISSCGGGFIIQWDIQDQTQLCEELRIRDLGCYNYKRSDDICAHGVHHRWIQVLQEKVREQGGTELSVGEIVNELHPFLEDLGLEMTCEHNRRKRKKTRNHFERDSNTPGIKIEHKNNSLECVLEDGSRVAMASIPRVTCFVTDGNYRTIGCGTQDGNVFIMKFTQPSTDDRYKSEISDEEVSVVCLTNREEDHNDYGKNRSILCE